MTEQDKITIFDALIKPFLCSDAPLGKLNGESAYKEKNPLHAIVVDLNDKLLPQNRAFKKFTPR